MGFCFYLLAAFLGICACDVVFGPCVSPNGTSMAIGDVWAFSQPCQTYNCGVDPKGNSFVEISKCPRVNVQSPCYLKTVPYLTYPDCCPTKECRHDNNGFLDNGGYYWNPTGHGKK